MNGQTQKKARPQSRTPALANPKLPLDKPSKELFAQMVADMVPVKDAYARAGYTGNEYTRSQLRRSADVDARIRWLLQNRVDSQARARLKPEKKIEDIRLRLLKEYEAMAFADARAIVQWDRVPVMDAEGNVTGYRDEMQATPSRLLTRDQAAIVKSVTTKSGALRVEVHDKLNAMEKLGKVLGIFIDAAPPVANVTNNIVNVGDVPALEMARRLAFILASAGASPPAPVVIEAKAEPEEPAKG